METSEMEELFWQVFKCDGEDELHKIVTSNEYFKNPNNWSPYGENKSNFKDFDNQQPRSGQALVEKITNSIDALLLKKCKQAGVDPKSPEAPHAIENATERFFNIPKGEIGELLGKERAQMARDNIQVIATGADDAPDIMIYDDGEGKHPDNFKNTFLSIGKGNKTDIAFVQGKYNVGSTGAVTFCGEYRYQLIASKMNQEIFGSQSDYAENLFGWTLVRRHVLTDEENSGYNYTWYEYFAVGGTKIPQFSIDEIDIGLYEDKKFITGAFVKLFSYEMPIGQGGAIQDGLFREFTQLLYKPALPFSLYEKRSKYADKTVGEIAVYGNHVRINGTNRQKDLLEMPPIYAELEDKEIGKVAVHAILLKKGKDSRQQLDTERNYIGRGRNIIYVLNGQAQGTEGQSFITQDLKYNLLKNSLLIVIDCSKTNTSFRQDIFMANRCTMKQGKKLEKLKKKVVEVLKEDGTLRELNSQRKDALLRGGDDSEEKELLENLFSQVPMDKDLVNLLGIDGNIANLLNQPNQFKSARHKQKKDKPKSMPRETKRFPSIFKINLKENQAGQKVKTIPLNAKGAIQFDTDVDEDYFYRPHEKGKFQIQILGGKRRNDSDNPNPKPTPEPTDIKDVFEISRTGPSDGSIKLTLKPKAKSFNVGDEIELSARMTSPDGDLESIFYVKIVDPQKHEKKKVEKEPDPITLPKPIKITKTDTGNWKKDNGEIWNESGWNEDSIIHIIAGDGEKKIVDGIAVNMSSNLLQKYLSKNQAKSEKDISYLRKQYFSKVYLHGLFLYLILEKMRSQERQKDEYPNETKDSEEVVAQIFRDYGKVLLYLDANKQILEALNN